VGFSIFGSGSGAGAAAIAGGFGGVGGGVAGGGAGFASSVVLVLALPPGMGLASGLGGISAAGLISGKGAAAGLVSGGSALERGFASGEVLVAARAERRALPPWVSLGNGDAAAAGLAADLRGRFAGDFFGGITGSADAESAAGSVLGDFLRGLAGGGGVSPEGGLAASVFFGFFMATVPLRRGGRSLLEIKPGIWGAQREFARGNGPEFPAPFPRD